MIDQDELHSFLVESNRIGRVDKVSDDEMGSAADMLRSSYPLRRWLSSYVHVTAGAPIRDRKGMDVRIGKHRAPPGGEEIPQRLDEVIDCAANLTHIYCPYSIHHMYEGLHPFMGGNGRSGRLLWLWMHLQADTYMGIGFLHQWYYETLDAGHEEAIKRQRKYEWGYLPA